MSISIMNKLRRITTLILIHVFALLMLHNTVFALDAITYGQTVSGSISVAAEKDEFTFSGTSGESITIRFAKSSGSLVPYVELLNPSGTRITYSTAGVINTSLSATGTFKITIRDNTNTYTGNYSISIQRLVNPVGAVALSFGQTLSGSVDSFAKMDAYTFNASANDVIYVRAGVVTTTSGTFETNLELFDPAGSQIVNTPNGFIQKVSTTGMYCLMVDDQYRNGSGTYSLSIQRVNNPIGASALSFGQTVSGSIDSFAQMNAYTFNASANDVIYVRAGVVTTSSGTFESNLELFDPTGTRIINTPNGFIQKVTATGTYCLVVDDQYRNGSGTYSLSIQRPNNPAGATTLSFGQTVSGSIDSFAQMNAYTITANANDVIVARTGILSTTSGTFDPFVELFDSSGTRVAYSVTSINQKVTTGGTYFLFISDQYRNGKGIYSLSIQRPNNPVGATQFGFGQTLTGSIGAYAQMDVYTFTANANDNIFVQDVKITNTSGTFDTYVELFDSSGTRIASMAGNFQKRLPSTGQYCLMVSDQSCDGTGTYSLSMQRTNNPASAVQLTFGQTVSANVDSFAQINAYTFSANANDVIYVNTGIASTKSGTFDTYLMLFDASGTGVISAAARMIVKVSKTGTYCLLVVDQYKNGTGTYSLSFQRANNPAGAVDLSYDSINKASIEAISGMNVYTLTAQAADTITFCSAIKQGTNFDLGVELFDSTGTRLLAVWGTTSIKYTFTLSGTFYLFITDNGRNGTGTYKFSVVKSDILCSTLDLVDPKVTISTPKACEIVRNNSVYNITWTSSDNIGVTWQQIQLSIDSGVSYPTVIATDLAGTVKSYSWSIPANMTSASARIKVIARDAKNNEGYGTAGDFAIINTENMPADSVNAAYQYDNQNRLTQSNTTQSVTYSYDQAGNRLDLNTY